VYLQVEDRYMTSILSVCNLYQDASCRHHITEAHKYTANKMLMKRGEERDKTITQAENRRAIQTKKPA